MWKKWFSDRYGNTIVNGIYNLCVICRYKFALIVMFWVVYMGTFIPCRPWSWKIKIVCNLKDLKNCRFRTKNWNTIVFNMKQHCDNKIKFCINEGPVVYWVQVLIYQYRTYAMIGNLQILYLEVVMVVIIW